MDKHNRLIAIHIAAIADTNEFNTFITVPFTTPIGWIGPRLRLTQRDIADGSRMFRAYINHLRHKLWGRRKSNVHSTDNKLPVIGVPEYKTKSKDDCPLHYHAVAKIPDDLSLDAVTISRAYWDRIGRKHFGCPIEPDIQPAWDGRQAIHYSMKNIDDDVVIQNMVVSGPITLS